MPILEDLPGVSFEGQDLSSYTLVGDFTGANFTGTNLAGADLTAATFQDADFTGATMPDGSTHP